MNTKHHQRLEDEMLRVRTARGWSLRRAERQTGVGVGTLQNMSAGRRVGAELVMEWARAIGEPERDWLEWAGYPALAARLDGTPGAPATAPDAAEAPVPSRDASAPGNGAGPPCEPTDEEVDALIRDRQLAGGADEQDWTEDDWRSLPLRAPEEWALLRQMVRAGLAAIRARASGQGP